MENNAYFFKLESGEITLFDNFRVTHGRNNFTAGTRTMEGAYASWDGVCSKAAQLESEIL